jgi:hypothetical protein
MNKPDLVELRYQSQSVNDMGILGLTRIIDVATVTNSRLGITGVLFFDKGHFGQILEGPRGCVEEVWSRIQKDERHCNIEFLGMSEIKERRFPIWAMKLFDVQEFSIAFPTFSDVVSKMTDQDLVALSELGKLWFRVD